MSSRYVATLEDRQRARIESKVNFLFCCPVYEDARDALFN